MKPSKVGVTHGWGGGSVGSPVLAAQAALGSTFSPTRENKEQAVNL